MRVHPAWKLEWFFTSNWNIVPGRIVLEHVIWHPTVEQGTLVQTPFQTALRKQHWDVLATNQEDETTSQCCFFYVVSTQYCFNRGFAPWELFWHIFGRLDHCKLNEPHGNQLVNCCRWAADEYPESDWEAMRNGGIWRANVKQSATSTWRVDTAQILYRTVNSRQLELSPNFGQFLVLFDVACEAKATYWLESSELYQNIDKIFIGFLISWQPGITCPKGLKVCSIGYRWPAIVLVTWVIPMCHAHRDLMATWTLFHDCCHWLSVDIYRNSEIADCKALRELSIRRPQGKESRKSVFTIHKLQRSARFLHFQEVAAQCDLISQCPPKAW